ncbi:MAG: hypothetical protein MUD05_12475 [Candidatus Nanopelagicales bacterium]|nr:hypothetical protein [Candidatus Nanopelagicales bacterium]
MRERLFVALWLPDAVRAELDTALAALHARYPELRWQPPVRWHITLAFLGDREPDRELRRFATIPLVTPEPLESCVAGNDAFEGTSPSPAPARPPAEGNWHAPPLNSRRSARSPGLHST